MENKKANPISDILNSSIENLNQIVDTNTIIGTPIVEAGVTIIPVSKVTFGYASGGSEIPSANAKLPFGGGSGGGVTITPIAFIIINKGNVDVVQISAPNNTADRIVNMIPGIFDKVSGIISESKAKKETDETEPSVE